jgi:predicted Zn-dependent peptidase
LKGLPDGVRRTVLKGGLRVVTEQMPGVRSAAVGVFVQVGSRDEAAQLNGASHFLEHLLFKGTSTRSAMDISTAFDEVGGEFNAYTAREYTCYHARVLDDDLPMALDVLGDMLTASLLASEDVEAEREVILDEIAMHDDDPDDVVHNLFAATAWAGTPLARPIAGTAESIKALSRRQVTGYYKRRYRPEVTTLAVAGNVDHDDVVRRARRSFSRNGFLDGDGRPAGPRVAARPRPLHPGEVSASRPFEQVNVVLGMQGITRSDPRRYVLNVVQAALGGSSSSRLFQEIRERRGLAYSVYSFGLGYSDAGMVGVAAGSLPSKADELLRVVREELTRVADSGFTDEEVERGKGQARGGLVLSLEDSGSRMTRLGEAELFQRRLRSVDEVLESLESVTQQDVHTLARELYTRPQTLAQVGPPGA